MFLVDVDREEGSVSSSGEDEGKDKEGAGAAGEEGASGPTTSASGGGEGGVGEGSSPTHTGGQEPTKGDSTNPGNPDENAEDKPGGDAVDPGKCKDGSSRACAKHPNGDIIEYPGAIARPPCGWGTETCEDGKWGPCLGAVAPKEMDTCEPGNDDNCNGIANDHCKCVAGTTQECGTNQGICKPGTMTCLENGVWGDECVGEIKPKAKEICDGKADDNCDGKTDEENCECIFGKDKLKCPGSNVGICDSGYYKCTLDGVYDRSECFGQVKAQPEKCDGRGLDEDCDGAADLRDSDCDCIDGREEACGHSNTGICRLGKRYCRNGKWGKCVGAVMPKAQEICDGKLDHNCNNISDQQECECINDTLSPCKVPGKRGDCSLGVAKCRNGRLGVCTSRFRPIKESCRDRPNDDHRLPAPVGDEDCDGLRNESDAGNSFLPVGGVEYMKDEDGDGFGAMGPGGIRRYCVDNDSGRPSYFVRATSNKNKDCGDCPGPSGRAVNPSVTDHSTVESTCLREEKWRWGFFDYNCDKREVAKYTLVGTCEEKNEECITVGTWWDEIPGCGVEATAVDCRFPIIPGVDKVCARSNWHISETQACI